jgi:hypothetical protein
VVTGHLLASARAKAPGQEAELGARVRSSGPRQGARALRCARSAESLFEGGGVEAAEGNGVLEGIAHGLFAVGEKKLVQALDDGLPMRAPVNKLGEEGEGIGAEVDQLLAALVELAAATEDGGVRWTPWFGPRMAAAKVEPASRSSVSY